tara:strand:- start:2074 stop:2412 length:339 start_codon:yes stop_codon:yes gene_type:complete
MNNQEILGMEPAYEHACQCAYGANMSISAPLVVDMVERIVELENQWISVEDRLPEFFRYVLIYHPAMRCTLLGSFIKGSHKFRDVAGNSFYKDDVTHWMPLPEPPKEQGNEK